MAKKFSKPELSRKINGDIPFDAVISDEPNTTERFDVLLLQQYPRYSRTTLQKLIKDGRATVNGEVVLKPNTLVEENAVLELNLPQIEGERPPVIYEDEHVIVFNKPAGMLSIKKGAYLAESSIDDFGIIVQIAGFNRNFTRENVFFGMFVTGYVHVVYVENVPFGNVKGEV